MKELLQCGCDCNLGPVEKKVVELMRLHTPPYEILRVLAAAIDGVEAGTFGIEIDTVNDTMTYNGKVYKLEINERRILQREFSDINVNLSYDIIDALGGNVTPTLEYSQVVTTYFSDGSTEAETIRSGATIQFGTSAPNAQIDINTGTVIVGASTLTADGQIGVVTMSIAMNGVAKIVSVQLRQKAKLAEVFKTKVFVGSLNVSRENFSSATVAELKEGAEAMEISTKKTGYYQASKPAFYILLPADAVMEGVTYGSAPLITDIKGQSLWNISHEDVTIDGKTYKVYGYYSGMVDAEHRLTYDYVLNVGPTKE